MLTVKEAIIKLTGAIKPLVASECVSIADSLGRVLAVDVEAMVNVPPADNSAMDGYAFCYAAAAAQGFELPLSQRIVAGSAPRPLVEKSVARIFTGGELPSGADTVAMQENCTPRADRIAIDPAVALALAISNRWGVVVLGAAVITEVNFCRGICVGKPAHRVAPTQQQRQL